METPTTDYFIWYRYKTKSCYIWKKDDDILLKPNDKDAREYIFVNGKNIPQEGQILKTKDRIIFGTNTICLYMKTSTGDDIYDIDWETAQLELQREIEEQTKRQNEENEKKKTRWI